MRALRVTEYILFSILLAVAIWAAIAAVFTTVCHIGPETSSVINTRG